MTTNKWSRLQLILLGIYSIAILSGGVIGYLKANSLVSLIMGVSFTLILIFSIWAIALNRMMGNYSALGVSTTLFFFFTYRFLGSYALFPAGVMMALSLFMIGIMIYPLCKSQIQEKPHSEEE